MTAVNFNEKYNSLRGRALQIVALLEEIADLIDDKPDGNRATCDQFVPGLGMHRYATMLRQRSADIKQGHYTLLCIGDFNNGKSSLLNALLGENKLPVGATPKTAVITRITYGEDNRVLVYRDGYAEPLEMTHDEFHERFSLQVAHESEINEEELFRVRYALFFTTHPLSQRGIQLVDSPGLGENIRRSDVTRRFLHEAQGVIIVLNAKRLLTQTERTFLDEEFGNNSLRYVFFVINRLDEIRDLERERPRLERRARRYLGKYFYGADHQVDEDLWSRRVFWLSAMQALNARSGENHEAFERSGFAAFEQELGNTLTQEYIFTASLASTIHVLLQIWERVKQYVTEQKSVIAQPLDSLRTRQQQTEQELQLLDRRRQSIEKNILSIGERVQLQLEVGLIEHIDRMERHWQNDREEIIKSLDAITTWDVVAAIVPMAKSKREEIALLIKQAIETYLKSQFSTWANEMSSQIEAELDTLQDRLQDDFKKFYQELGNIQATFTQHQELSLLHEHEQFSSEMIRTFAVGGSNLSEVIMGVLQRLLIIMAIIAGIPLVTVAMILAIVLIQVKVFSDKERSLKERIINRIIPEVLQHLRDDLHTEIILPGNITNAEHLAAAIHARETPFARAIWERLSEDTRNELVQPVQETFDRHVQLQQRLSSELQKITGRREVFRAEHLVGFELKDVTRNLLQQCDTLLPEEERRLHRLLLHEHFPEYLSSKPKDLIYENIQRRFIELAQSTTQSLRASIDEVRARMDTTIAELEQNRITIEDERQRLDMVCEAFQEKLRVLSNAYQHTDTPEELTETVRTSLLSRQR
jgi:tRNA U34 5-carboxymethylaminomethyl modifying GTPase MnmE/TrmE